MYRLDHDKLALDIQMAIWRAVNPAGARVRRKGEDAERAIQTEIVKLFVNDHTAIVVTDSVGFGMDLRRGRFGADEPWPAPLDIERHARPAKG